MGERLLLTASFALAAHLFFEKKDRFFIFRALGGVVSWLMLLYLVWTRFVHLEPDLFDYSFLLLATSLLIILVKFLKARDFSFLKLQRQNLNLRGMGVSLGLILLVMLVCVAYFRELLLLPHYVSIDAPLHFSRFRYFTEFNYNSNDSACAFTLFLIFSNLFFLATRGVENVLADFQLVNLLLFALISVYFYLLMGKKFALKSRLLKVLAFTLPTFGFFFTLFIFGFVPQLAALFLVLVFWDLWPGARESWMNRILLLATAVAIYFSYTFWIGVLVIYLGLVFFKYFYFSPAKLKFIAKVSPLMVLGGLFIWHKISILKMAVEEGEIYRTFTANFWMFAPMLPGGLYLMLKKWRQDNSYMTSAVGSSLIFSGGFGLAYSLGYVSSYTFFKGLFLAGAFIFYVSFYFLDQLEQGTAGRKWRRFNQVFGGILIILMLYPLIPWGTKNDLQVKLVSSIDKEDIWSIKQRPLDVMYFNIKAFEDRENRVENFVAFDQEKIEFLRELRPYLPERIKSYYTFYDPMAVKLENRMMMAADFKTSYWVFAMTKIWNRSLDVMEVHNTKLIDYDDWVKTHHDPYLMILDTQTTNRWLWLNEDKFQWDDFDILYQHGKNYLLKYKD